MQNIPHALRTIIAIAMFAVALSSVGHAQSTTTSTVYVDSRAFMDVVSANPTAVERGFTVAPHALESISGSSDIVLRSFPIGTAVNADLVLERRRPVVDARTAVLVGTDSGDYSAPLPLVVSFSGHVRGEPGSRAFLSIAGQTMYGYVERANGQRSVIGPRTTNGADGHEHVVTSESRFPELVRDVISNCVSTAGPSAGVLLRADANSAIDNRLLEVKIAVEADQEFFRRTGGTVESATSYIVALWSMVSAMYEDEINVTFRLSWIKVWSTQDPYQVAGNGYELWTKAPAYWRDNYAQVDRDLAHIFTASDWGGGGIAFRGEGVDGREPVICSKNTGYAMSSPRAVLTYPTFAFTYDAYIVAHETGHNFGARHTHDCWWNPAIDTCMTRDDAAHRSGDACHVMPITPRPSPGSVMSYCMGANQQAGGGSFESWSVRMQFTPRVADVMRREIELATCKHEPATPTIVLTSPRGMTTRYGIDTLPPITWNSVGVVAVNLQYSTNSGAAWTTFAQNVNAATASYVWTDARVCADRVLVRIADSGDDAVADSSLLPFAMQSTPPARPTITQRGDTLVAPAGFIYRWYRDGAEISGENSNRILVAAPGLYSLTIHSDGGCSSNSDPFAYNPASSDDESFATPPALQMRLSSEGPIAVRFHLATRAHAQLAIVDQLGRNVAVLIDASVESGWHDVAAPNALPRGTYWIVLRAEGRLAAVPFTL